MRVAGPNAGHTVVGADGTRWPLRQVPVAAVADPGCALYIAPGSEVDVNVLAEEVRSLDRAGYGVTQRLFISPQATLLTPEHQQVENTLGIPFGGGNFGSTKKGIGAARADRIMRAARLYGDEPKSQLPVTLHGVTVGDPDLRVSGMSVLIEGTQGYGLGLHAGWYPYCTSSDARAVDFCAMAGLSPWQWEMDVWVCLRPYPIRIAGNSGPLFEETSWEELGLPVEYTTVTHKPRRVGRWDPVLAQRAVSANGGSLVNIAFTMADQVVPEIAGLSGVPTRGAYPGDNALAKWVNRIEGSTGADVRLVGTGPNSMMEV